MHGTATINAGVVNARNATALGTTGGGVTVASGAALELQGGMTIGAEALGLSGTGISSGGALRNISGDNTWQGNVTLNAASRMDVDADDLTISGNIIGANTLTKDGPGWLILSGDKTYSGNTTVSAGTMVIEDWTDDSDFTVASGATLMGDGAVKGLTINGHVDPGNSMTAQDSLGCGAVTLGSGGSMQVDISDASGTAGTDWDVLSSSGTVTVNGQRHLHDLSE